MSMFILSCTNVLSEIIIFSDDFENGEFKTNWVTKLGSSGVVAAAVMSSVNSVEVAKLGLFGVALGRSTSGSLTTNFLDLHLDLSSYEQVELSFQLKDTDDETHTEDGLFFSDDGGNNFKKVYGFNVGRWVDVYGKLPPIDIDHLASENGLSLSSNFVIRFQQHDDGEFGTDGIYLDDVLVTSPTQTTYEKLPFSEGFESGKLSSSWKWSTPLATAESQTIDPSGFVGVISDINGIEVSEQGLYGVAMGRSTSGSLTTNSLDLHLNLSNHTQVELRFWMKDTDDETRFSNNGGQIFRKIFQLDPGRLTDGIFHEIVVDVDSLVLNLGLTLTEKSVIRFQHYDDGAFGTDGIYLDSLTVEGDGVSIPQENSEFEKGRLAGKQECIDNPISCGISSSSRATLSNDLKMSIPVLNWIHPHYL